MPRYELITPPEILTAFSNARVKVSMSEGDATERDSRGEAYKTVMITVPRLLKLSEVVWRQYVRKQFFRELLSFVGCDDAVIEWRNWPEIAIEGMNARVYARLTSRPRTIN